jgi:hypothetical protein
LKPPFRQVACLGLVALRFLLFNQMQMSPQRMVNAWLSTPPG